MGWTSYHAGFYKNGVVDRKKEIDKMFTQDESEKYPEIDPVWLECESDTDMADEIQSRFDDAIENGTDELDVYMEMLEAGINVPMVRKYMGNSVADAMQKFCEEHGLI